MRSLLLGALLALSGLAACDSTDNKDGARGACANGGALAGCPDSDVSDEAACWRLVECGFYPVEGQDPDTPDWGRCMDKLAAMGPEQATVIVQCVAGTTCDELGPLPGHTWPFCFQFGDNN